MIGVLNINKPSGWTSHDVVNKVRRILREKRIGHTGTLDPLATGVLVLCVGQATRIARYLEAVDKEYEAVMQLGTITDTLDIDGRILETRPFAPPDVDKILDAFRLFIGTISQRPPIYSAIKVSGVPSYKLARQGKAVELKERKITIHEITVMDYQAPYVRFSVRCSKGTYIRSLCSDVGTALGMGACLKSLIRTKSGYFDIKDAIDLEQLERMIATERHVEALIPMNVALSDLPSVQLDAESAARFGHGNPVPGIELPPVLHALSHLKILGPNGDMLGIALSRDGMIRPEVVIV